MPSQGPYHKTYERTCVLILISLVVILQSILCLLIVSNHSHNKILIIFYILNIGICILTPLFYKYTHSYFLSGKILLTYAAGAVTTIIVFSNGVNSPFIFWLIAPIILSSTLFRYKMTLLWSSIVFLIYIYLLYQDVFSHSIESNLSASIVTEYQRHAFIHLFLFCTACLVIHLLKIQRRMKWLYDGNEQVGSLIQILSHDIINPLNLILGFGELIKEETKEKELADGILRAGNQIREIINHVKEMQALETGKKDFVLTPINLTTAIDNISFVFKERIKNKNIDLVIKNELDSELRVLAEPVSFSHQVLNNLVSNAIKFTPENGEIIIHAYKKGLHVHINIQDTGIGIPEELISSLFRFDTVTSRKGTNGERGTGFGLPLVKKYIELYKGEIHVESIVLGDSSDVHGTNFHLVLNCA